VTDAVTGKPIAQAHVSGNGYASGPNHPPAQAWTDTNGHYELKTWSEAHTIVASAPGYKPLDQNFHIFPEKGRGIAGNGRGAMDFQLTPLSQLLDLTVKQPAQASLAPQTNSVAPPQDPPNGQDRPPAGLSEVPPVVIKTVPESGTSGVDPGLTEVRVTFSAPMKQGSYAWCTWGEGTQYFPETRGSASFVEDGRTCVLPVKLAPGKLYALWVNSESHDAFQDRLGHPAVPYLLIFETRK
jgi:RNA polymerase sigma-70 factor (ECF subfamily)